LGFLKLDVKGTELEVIGELYEAGKLRRVKQMVIEYHLHMTEEEGNFSEILWLLEDVGYGDQICAVLELPFKGGKYPGIHLCAYLKENAG